jgi:hypothetical protein
VCHNLAYQSSLLPFQRPRPKRDSRHTRSDATSPFPTLQPVDPHPVDILCLALDPRDLDVDLTCSADAVDPRVPIMRAVMSAIACGPPMLVKAGGDRDGRTWVEACWNLVSPRRDVVVRSRR